MIAGPRVRAPFWDDPIPGAVFRHGYTYSGHATACAAGMANLDLMEREDLVGRVRSLEPVLEREMGAAPLGAARVRGPDRRAHRRGRAVAEARAADPGIVDKVVGVAGVTAC